MRLLPLLLFLFITTTLFSQRELKGEYGPEYSVFWGGTSFKFDGKGNFEITKSSCLSSDVGSGAYTLNDSLLILEYNHHRADTPLYKSTVKYAGLPANDSIEVQITLIDMEYIDSNQLIYSVDYYSLNNKDLNERVSGANTGLVKFRLPVKSIPCELIVENYNFLYGMATINQPNNAEVIIYAKQEPSKVQHYIPSGTVEKYRISNISRDGFCLMQLGYGAFWCYKKR